MIQTRTHLTCFIHLGVRWGGFVSVHLHLHTYPMPRHTLPFLPAHTLGVTSPVGWVGLGGNVHLQLHMFDATLHVLGSTTITCSRLRLNIEGLKAAEQCYSMIQAFIKFKTKRPVPRSTFSLNFKHWFPFTL